MFEPPCNPIDRVTRRIVSADLSRMQPHSRPDHAPLEPVRGGSRATRRDARCKCRVIKMMRSSVSLVHEPRSSHGMSRTFICRGSRARRRANYCLDGAIFVSEGSPQKRC